MAEKDLKALFVHQLKDTYFAENAILKALPQMAEAAQSDELRGALAIHLRETEGQVKRLEQVFQLVGERPEGVECKAIQGIIEEGQEILQEFEGGEALDAGLIAAAQAVEHYEITRYGTLLAWAKQLGLSEAEGLIQETLIEEENTDELLSDLAEDAINPATAARSTDFRAAFPGGPRPNRLNSATRAASAPVQAAERNTCSPDTYGVSRLRVPTHS
jgi:ferritin-like metal-binding protein YciE